MAIYETKLSVLPVYNHDGMNVTLKHINLDQLVVNVHYKQFFFTAVKKILFTTFMLDIFLVEKHFHP